MNIFVPYEAIKDALIYFDDNLLDRQIKDVARLMIFHVNTEHPLNKNREQHADFLQWSYKPENIGFLKRYFLGLTREYKFRSGKAHVLEDVKEIMNISEPSLDKLETYGRFPKDLSFPHPFEVKEEYTAKKLNALYRNHISVGWEKKRGKAKFTNRGIPNDYLMAYLKKISRCN